MNVFMRFRDIYESNRERYFQRSRDELFGDVSAWTITWEGYLEELEELKLSERSWEFIFSAAIKSVVDELLCIGKTYLWQSSEYFDAYRNYIEWNINKSQYLSVLDRLGYLRKSYWNLLLHRVVWLLVSKTNNNVSKIIKGTK